MFKWGLALAVALPLINPSASELCNAQRKPASTSEAKLPHYKNTEPGVAYVGSRTCARCHTDIYRSFIKTDMGRSVLLPDDPSQQTITSKPVTVEEKKFNRYFQVLRKGKDLYQSEYELGTDGREIFRSTYKVEYVIGSGANGFTYIVKRGNYLFEAPLSYYSRSKSWGLSPGYEFGDYGFSRPIHAACITCHSGLPQPVPQRSGLYKDPPFREMAVGCENCHGPGGLHVKQMVAGILPKGKIDPNIVNPAQLPGWLADNICMKCHQGGDARFLQPGKNYSDFRPGTPLNNTVAVLAVPFTPQLPPESPLLQHYELMIMSKCYRTSGKQLHCITCHDPHQLPSASQAPAYYRQKCLTCHTDSSCSLPRKVRLQQHPADNCIGCHMPKERLKVISHSALTNHRIIAYKGEPFPEAAYHQTTSRLPDLIYFDAIPGSKTSLPPIVLLQAYGQLMLPHPSFRPKYLALLQQLQQSDADNPIVLSAAAREKLSAGTNEAADLARKDLALAIKQGSTEPSDYEVYADTLAQNGDMEGAIAVLKRGIALDPYYRRFYKNLAMRYIAAKRYDDALQTIKQELALFPEDSFMRKVLDLAQGAPRGR
jgi:Tetratricopeptide repeat